MDKLILRLEELQLKAKGISDLIGALFYTGEYGTSLNAFLEGLSILYELAIDNSIKLEEVWLEMLSLNQNNKTGKDGDSV